MFEQHSELLQRAELFKNKLEPNKNTLVVTHSGMVNALKSTHIVNGRLNNQEGIPLCSIHKIWVIIIKVKNLKLSSSCNFCRTTAVWQVCATRSPLWSGLTLTAVLVFMCPYQHSTYRVQLIALSAFQADKQVFVLVELLMMISTTPLVTAAFLC